MVFEKEDALRFYNNYQEIYKRPRDYFQPLAAELLSYLTETNPRILDVGCGFGDFLATIYEHLGNKAEYYGLTIAKREAEFIKKERSFIKVVLGKEQDLEKFFDNQSFDLIINFHTLSYIGQKEQISVAKEMVNLLRPKGIIYLGLIDNWIKVSRGISQTGDGFVQFYYSPTIFLILSRYCKLTSSEIKKEDNYRVYLWQKQSKSSAPWKGALLYAGYTIRNNLLFLGYFQKLIRKLRV